MKVAMVLLEVRMKVSGCSQEDNGEGDDGGVVEEVIGISKVVM